MPAEHIHVGLGLQTFSRIPARVDHSIWTNNFDSVKKHKSYPVLSVYFYPSTAEFM